MPSEEVARQLACKRSPPPRWADMLAALDADEFSEEGNPT